MSASLERDLAPRMPGARWEGWFVIGIGARACEVRWTKTHLFRTSRVRGMHPIAAVEGLRDDEVVTWVATRDHVSHVRSPVAAEPTHDGGAFAVRGGGVSLSSAGSRAALARLGAPHVELAIEAGDRLVWTRVPRALSYVGWHGALVGAVSPDAQERPFAGTGVVEHAWGTHVPFDPLRLVRGPWHWDVLAFPDDEAGAALAALALPIPAMGTRGVRAMGRLPGRPFVSFSRHAVQVLDRDHDRSPRRWRGELRDEHRIVSYEAVASTPPARVAPGITFVGLDAEVVVRDGADRRTLDAAGFCEHGERATR